MGQHDLGAPVESLHATLEKLPTVQVIVGRPLKETPSGNVDDKVVVWRRSDVARLAEVANPLVLALVVPAQLGGVVGRRVVRDDDLKVFIALSEQGIESLGEVAPTVVDGKPDTQ